jgi:hypothetical protein
MGCERRSMYIQSSGAVRSRDQLFSSKNVLRFCKTAVYFKIAYHVALETSCCSSYGFQSVGHACNIFMLEAEVLLYCFAVLLPLPTYSYRFA